MGELLVVRLPFTFDTQRCHHSIRPLARRRRPGALSGSPLYSISCTPGIPRPVTLAFHPNMYSCGKLPNVRHCRLSCTPIGTPVRTVVVGRSATWPCNKLCNSCGTRTNALIRNLWNQMFLPFSYWIPPGVRMPTA